VYVGDVVKANLLASGKSSISGIFNIARGESTSLKALAAMIGKILGREVVPRHEEARPADIRHSRADVGKARSIGYSADCSLEDGLRETMAWFRQEATPG
jgi:nucleoside-diphosphate-sugar epimerase